MGSNHPTSSSSNHNPRDLLFPMLVAVGPSARQDPVDDGVVVVAGLWVAEGDDEAGVGVDDSVSGGVRHPEQGTDLARGQVRPPVGGDQQYPISEVKRPLPARSTVGDRVPATRSATSRTSLRNWAGCSPVNGKIHSGRAAGITCTPT